MVREYIKNPPETTYIYGLIDPDSNKLRYIGKSDDPKARLSCHLVKAQRSVGSTIYHKRRSWLLNILKRKRKPRLVILEETSQERARERELHWIKVAFESGAPLVNNEHDIRAALAGESP